MTPLMTKLTTLVHDSVDFILVSTFVVAAGLFMGGWKKHMEYPVSAILLGTVFGMVCYYTPMLEPFKFVAAILGAAVGPKTLASLQKKTLKDVLNDYLAKDVLPKDEDKAE